MIYVFQIYGCIELRFKIPHVCHILKKKKKKKKLNKNKKKKKKKI